MAIQSGGLLNRCSGPEHQISPAGAQQAQFFEQLMSFSINLHTLTEVLATSFRFSAETIHLVLDSLLDALCAEDAKLKAETLQLGLVAKFG